MDPRGKAKMTSPRLITKVAGNYLQENKEIKEDSMGLAQEKAPEGANEKKQSKEQNEEAILQS